MRFWQVWWDDFLRSVSPKHFYEVSARWQPWFWGLALCLLPVGLVWGLLFAPADYQQGNSYRIVFIHVPAASLAMSAYAGLAVCGLIHLVWKVKTADMVARAIAPLGAWFTVIALLTGAIWGKPTWGTYWTWDARLTSMLVLLFLYLGVIAIYNAFESVQAGGKAGAILAMVGVVNLPIIKYSVEWWNTLHQASTFKLTAKPTMPPEMYLPLVIMVVGFYAFFAGAVLMRTRCEIIERERRASWVRELIGGAD